MIKLDGVHKKFDGRGIAGLHGIDLEIKDGEIFAVMGANGSGKSSLLNIMAGEIVPDQGKVQKEGEVTIFHGASQMPDLNVQEHLTSQVKGPMDNEKKLQLARDLADIFEFTFQLRQTVGQLSAGQKQKVALAAELIKRPGLFLMDEPFAHLDPHTRKEILHTLFEHVKRQGLSIVWVTHDLNEAFKFSDRIGILHHGKFEQIGTPIDLSVTPRNLFVAQFLGHENFMVLKLSDHGWMTPWGLWDLKAPIALPEAILVIPEDVWEISSEGATFKTMEVYREALNWIIKVMRDEKVFRIRLRHGTLLPQVGDELTLRVRPENCFLIAL